MNSVGNVFVIQRNLPLPPCSPQMNETCSPPKKQQQQTTPNNNRINNTTPPKTLILNVHQYFYGFVWHYFNYHNFLIRLCFVYFSNKDQIFNLVKFLFNLYCILRQSNRMIITIITSYQLVCHWRLGNTHESRALTWQSECSGIHDDSSRGPGKPEENNFDTDTT